MLSKKIRNIRTVFVLTLFLFSGRLYSQETPEGTILFDTTDYVPSFYTGAIDYNLMIAASKGYIGEVNRLIMKGADIFAESNQGVTPLIFAISNNQTAVSKILLEYGSDPDKKTLKQETPLIIAVKNANAEITEALLRAGADIDITDRYDATPLHYASVYDYFQIADMLLYYDASIDKKTADGSTPLFSAIWAGNADVADLLIQNGANIETRDNEGFTPFLMAALNGDTLMMDLLIKKGVDIYTVNNSKHNALALTIIADKVDAAKYLLKRGNKWSDQANNAINPFNVASKYRRKDMLTILKDNQIPGSIKYKIDQVDIMASSRFLLHDIYTGVSFSLKEPYLNGGIIIGLDTKLWYTRVLQKQTENMFSQYWSKGSIFYAGLFKDFALTDNPFKANYSITTSLSAGYSFGDELKGTLIVPAKKFVVMPAAGLKWTKKDLSLSIGVDYVKSSFYHVGPIWLRLGASYNLYFDNIRTKGKTLKWF
jgi:ankyrin repeat protein